MIVYHINKFILVNKNTNGIIDDFDTLLVTAQEWGIKYVLMEKNEWYLSRIDEKRIKFVKYIAFYQTAPIYSINFYSKVKAINYNWKERHYNVILKDKPISIKPVILDKDKRNAAPQSMKYIKLSKLLKARKITDL